ncbi:putative delta-60 repeat protein [Pseudomonas sp. EB276 TE3739]|uniref:hypothetical protein n=1 Tax=Pseudomonas TaxID=286 RepID=UPI00209DF49C|nr:hypothetical protein [Pseudomonas koreensis]MCP1477624.1 putative delta-60 repeat protein [Pseudomonas koreensis]
MNVKNLGKPDPQFGLNGRVYMNQLGLPFRRITSRALDTDAEGAICVSGTVEDDLNAIAYFCIKLTGAGLLDKKFGNAGYISGQFDRDMKDSLVNEAKLLSDKKILLIGSYKYRDITDVGIALLRLLPSGEPDRDFGIGGKVILKPGAFILNATAKPAGPIRLRQIDAVSTVIASDGKILIVARLQLELIPVSLLIRLEPNGSLDISFNNKGYVEIAHPDFVEQTVLNTVLPTSDGKYALAGSVGPLHDSQTFFAQLLDTGELDTGFGENGYLKINPGPFEDSTSFSLIQQPNKRLLAVGHVSGPAHKGLLISREVDGRENIQFNGGNPVVEQMGNLDTIWANAFINRDGSILTFGAMLGSRVSTVMARFTHAGKLDLTYGNGTGWFSFDYIKQIRHPGIFMADKVTFLAMTMAAEDEHHCVIRALTD